MGEPVFVTKPFLPPLEELQPYLEEIWRNHRLTNGGPFHAELETSLADYLGVSQLSLFANGTLALVTALQELGIRGEVITTPYSFVATTHALTWNRIQPVFVDIDPDTLNLDPARIESAITPDTTAILATHIYGHPCDVEAIQKIADMYGLKVIYDAAHAFGVEDEGGSILRYGDMSILSFHATKVFNTFEGGAIVSPDEKTRKRVNYLKNFGFANETTVVDCGINGKMNELQAAIGLVQLRHINAAIENRREVDLAYRRMLADVKGLRLHSASTAVKNNYAYFPIFIEPDYPVSRDELYTRLREHNIFSRRYFYPLISEFPMYRNLPSALKGQLPVAEEISQQVICLPMYPGLEPEVQNRISEICQSP